MAFTDGPAESIGRGAVAYNTPIEPALADGCGLIAVGANLVFTDSPVATESYVSDAIAGIEIPTVDSEAIETALGFVPANDAQVVKKTGASMSGTLEHGNETESICYHRILTGSMPFSIEFFGGWSDFGGGQDDTNWSIQFNHERVAGYPGWGENIEVFFDTGSQRLIEKNWDYTSIDRSVSYRPFTFNVDIDTHEASQTWWVRNYTIKNRIDDAALLRLDTIAHTIQSTGQLVVAQHPSKEFTFGLTGAIGSGSSLFVYPTSLSNEAAIVQIVGPALTGEYTAISATGQANGIVGNILRNTAGPVREMLWAASGRDAWVRTLGGSVDCSFGVDASANAFRIDFGDSLGGNVALSIDATTKAATFLGRVLLGGAVDNGVNPIQVNGTILTSGLRVDGGTAHFENGIRLGVGYSAIDVSAGAGGLYLGGSPGALHVEVAPTGAMSCVSSVSVGPITKSALLTLSATATGGTYRITDSTPAQRRVWPDGTNWRYMDDGTVVT